jgi:hypothetical protein
MEMDDSPTRACELPAGNGSSSAAVLDDEVTDQTPLLAVPSAIPHSSSASSVTLINTDSEVSSDEAPLLKDIESTQSSTPEPEPDLAQTPDKPPRKPKKGWRDVFPFTFAQRSSRTSKRNWIAWSELTLREKYEYRRKFFLEYFSETRKCLPYVKKLFVAVYRISPWRATLLLFLNLVNGFLPALTLQTKGSFLILVGPQVMGLIVVANGIGEGKVGYERVDQTTRQPSHLKHHRASQ